MPKASPVNASKAASSSTKSSPADASKKEPNGYIKFCQENRERVKAEFPDLKGKAVAEKLTEQWWDSDENPKKGNRPAKKAKKVKDLSEKENATKEKKSKKEKKKEVEASGDK